MLEYVIVYPVTFTLCSFLRCPELESIGSAANARWLGPAGEFDGTPSLPPYVRTRRFRGHIQAVPSQGPTVSSVPGGSASRATPPRPSRTNRPSRTRPGASSRGASVHHRVLPRLAPLRPARLRFTWELSDAAPESQILRGQRALPHWVYF